MRRCLLAASMLVAAPAVAATFTPDNQSIIIDGNGVAHTNAPLRMATSSGSILASDLAGVVNFEGANLTATIPLFPASTVVVCNYDSTPLTLNPSVPIKGYSASTLPGLSNGSASCLNLTSDGSQWWAMVLIPGSVVSTGGGDTLVLQMSEDAWQGDAQFNVYLDGVKLNAAILTTTAIHGQGQSQAFSFAGSWGPGPHTLGIEFTNDLYGGSPSADRNLYLNSATYDGVPHSGGLALFSGGLQTMMVP